VVVDVLDVPEARLANLGSFGCSPSHPALGVHATSAAGQQRDAVVDVILAQFPVVLGLVSNDRIRRRRNQAEYPDPRGI
jgi:hypothetical protein